MAKRSLLSERSTYLAIYTRDARRKVRRSLYIIFVIFVRL